MERLLKSSDQVWTVILATFIVIFFASSHPPQLTLKTTYPRLKRMQTITYRGCDFFFKDPRIFLKFGDKIVRTANAKFWLKGRGDFFPTQRIHLKPFSKTTNWSESDDSLYCFPDFFLSNLPESALDLAKWLLGSPDQIRTDVLAICCSDLFHLIASTATEF